MDRHRAAALLGVGIDASRDEIRDAYRRRARTLHPDAGGVDPARMTELNLAYRAMREPLQTGDLPRREPREGSHEDPDPDAGARWVDDARIDDDDTVGFGHHDPLRLLRIALAGLALVMLLVMFVFAVGYDGSLGR